MLRPLTLALALVAMAPEALAVTPECFGRIASLVDYAQAGGNENGEKVLWQDSQLLEKIETSDRVWNSIYPRLSRVHRALEKSGKLNALEGRIKTLDSLRHKLFGKSLQKGAPTDLRDIADVLGFRFVLNDALDIAAVEASLKETLGDMVVTAKHVKNERGYAATHLIGQTRRGDSFEIQLMSQRMETWSKWDHDLAYKAPANLDADYLYRLREYSKAVGEYIQALDRGEKSKVSPPPFTRYRLRREHAFPVKTLERVLN